jgi:lysyl-tRNA synthetase class 2
MGFMSFLKISVMKEWTENNPEFTAMEIYVAYKDYNWMMEFTETCSNIAQLVLMERAFEVTKLALKRYARAMTDSIKHFTGFDISGKTEAELFAARGMGIEVETMGKGKLLMRFLAKCEGNYIQPTFITDYPNVTTLQRAP